MKPWAVSFCDATHRLVHCADQHYAAKFVDGHPQVFFTDRSEWTSRTVWAAVCGHVIALDLSKFMSMGRAPTCVRCAALARPT